MSDRKWVIFAGGLLVGGGVATLAVLLAASGWNTSLLAAVLALVGVLVTASVTHQSNRRLRQESVQADNRLRQEHEDEERRLKLDAAMRAGGLFSAADADHAHPAALASGLLALTKLDQAGLAVALLVDLWSRDSKKISHETAILVIDAALRSDQPNAQLVAAELLCRNAKELDPCQSLHWPSAVDGCWVPSFGPKTKLLLLDALVLMSKSRAVTENALRSLAVRLYGIWRDDDNEHVKGCVGMLIDALIAPLEGLGYTDFMQGNQEVMLRDLKTAADGAAVNPDAFLGRLVAQRRKELTTWAAECRTDAEPGGLAAAVHGVAADPRPL